MAELKISDKTLSCIEYGNHSEIHDKLYPIIIKIDDDIQYKLSEDYGGKCDKCREKCKIIDFTKIDINISWEDPSKSPDIDPNKIKIFSGVQDFCICPKCGLDMAKLIKRIEWNFNKNYESGEPDLTHCIREDKLFEHFKKIVKIYDGKIFRERLEDFKKAFENFYAYTICIIDPDVDIKASYMKYLPPMTIEEIIHKIPNTKIFYNDIAFLDQQLAYRKKIEELSKDRYSPEFVKCYTQGMILSDYSMEGNDKWPEKEEEIKERKKKIEDWERDINNDQVYWSDPIECVICHKHYNDFCGLGKTQCSGIASNFTSFKNSDDISVERRGKPAIICGYPSCFDTEVYVGNDDLPKEGDVCDMCIRELILTERIHFYKDGFF
jgi:hypothetical protein